MSRHSLIQPKERHHNAVLSLLGPFRLSDADGHDRTPASPRHQAILAILALAPNCTVSRAKLQDMLWGEKEPKRAAQSLRTALHALKAELKSFAAPLLEIDATSVRLNEAAVAIDVLEIERCGSDALPDHYKASPPDVLEGISFRGQEAEEFEDWLRSHRAYWLDLIEKLRDEVPGARTADAEETGSVDAQVLLPESPPSQEDLGWPVVGLLQPVIYSESLQTRFMGEALIDQIATGLRESLGARCYDYRDLTLEPDQTQTASHQPDLLLHLKLYEENGLLSLRISAMKNTAQELLWTANCTTGPSPVTSTDNPDILAFLGEVLERAADTLSQRNQLTSNDPLSPYHALNAMFQLDHTALGGLRARLEDSWRRSGKNIYPALLAYLNTFSVGEHWRPFDSDVRDETRALIDSADDTGRSGGLTLALAGHAKGYVLHDKEGAADLLERAIKLGPQSAFCWDHLALHYLYSARYAEAQQASAIALKLGALSPLRFTLETTQCMINVLEGRYTEASTLGMRVLSRRPKFGAALRYTTISLAHLGNAERAHDYLNQIREMDPDFSVEWVKENRMAVQDKTAKEILEIGLKNAGA